MNNKVDPRHGTDDRIHSVINGLRPPIAIKGKPEMRWNLAERMRYYHVPGVSMTIIDNRQISWFGGFGVKSSGSPDKVDAATLFQAASISKPIVATAVLSLADAGRITLDEDVNNYLRSWKIPENEYAVREKVTLRRILSHSAGITVHGFAGYESTQPIPSLLQILDGLEPANSPAIRIDIQPGSQWRYSGGGFTVMQQMLVDMLDDTFPSIMDRMVLQPAGMYQSTFEQPLPGSRSGEAASGHDVTGKMIEGNRHVYPELAAAGLWTTPTDLAKWALEITHSLEGRSDKVFSREMAQQMMTVQASQYGLGVVLEGTGQVIGFSHGGENAGFLSYLIMFPEKGKGAVIMNNSDLGRLLISEIIPAIADEYKWPGHHQSEREPVTLETGQIDSIPAEYTVTGTTVPITFDVTREDDRLFIEVKGYQPKNEIFAENSDRFFSADGRTFEFVRDNLGQAEKLNTEGLVAVRQEQ